MNALRRVLAAGLVMAGMALPVFPARTAGAEEPVDLSTITAMAIASGQRASLGTTGTQAVSDLFDGVGPVAESRFDGLGGGQSLASLPYPGATIRQYPAYVALAGGGEAPAYPFYVAAHPGEPEAKQSDPTGTYLIEAKASREGAGSVARLHGSGDLPTAGSISTTSIKTEGGTVTATAESITEGLSFGALKVASVFSKSVTTYKPGDPEPKTVTELRIDGGAIDDQRFSFGPDGLTVTSQGVPVPLAQGVETLNAVFRQDGLSVRFLGPEKVTGGAQAGTFEVSLTRNLPDGGSGVLRLRFGQAASAVVPGGDVLPATPVDGVTSPSDGSSPAEETAAEPAAELPAEPVASADAPLESPSLFSAEETFPPEPVSDAFSPGLEGDALGTATGDPAGADGAAASTPEVALGTPEAPGPTARPARLASTAIVSAVDGIYAAVGWAALAVLGLTLIWRQGARKWTS